MANGGNIPYILGSFATQGNPNFIGRQRRAGIGAAYRFDGSKDPNKSVIAQQAPSALSNPEANISDIIGGAIAKSPMSLAASQARDPSVDTSSLGNFGEVNSSAGTDATGAQPKTTKGNFWDSKGGGILQSLLGVLALGGLGAGIGAISGGGRGALQGASYGMGFGALQDLALRKSAMEGTANEEKLQYDLEKAQLSAVPTSKREFDLAQQMPEYGKFLQEKDPYKSAYYNLAIQKEGRIEDEKMKEWVNKFRETSEGTISTLRSFDNIEQAMGFDLSTYDPKTGTVSTIDPKTKKQIRVDLDLPGKDVPGLGRQYWGSEQGRNFKAALQALKNIRIRDSAGLSQTLSEVERFEEQLASGKFNTQYELAKALQDLQKEVYLKLSNIESGFDNKVVSQFMNQGGLTLRDFLSPNKKKFYGIKDRVFSTPSSMERKLPGSKGNISPKQSENIPKNIPQFAPGTRDPLEMSPEEREAEIKWLESQQ